VIAEHLRLHPNTSMMEMCSAMSVNRSWYYARSAAQEPTEEDILLRDAIELLALENPCYGYRRMTRQLQRDGWTINHKRVLRIMREESLLCRIKKRFVNTTDSQHPHPIYINRMKNLCLSRCNQAWVADITYIRLPRNFCYLAAILDAYSRRCVGWHLSIDIDTCLTLAALEKAIMLRAPAAGLIHHSDRGVQYASSAYVARLEQIGALPSMSAKGNPYDNAKAESFFKTLKREEVYLNEYQNFQDAQRNLGRFIEDVYNTKRLHSSLDYLPPKEFEAAEATRTAMLATGICLENTVW
jgi:transposase InsO family protein